MSGSKNLALLALSRIFCATMPLKIRELQRALAIKTGMKFFDPDNIVEITLVVSVCADLMTVDESSNTAGLVHYTRQQRPAILCSWTYTKVPTSGEHDLRDETISLFTLRRTTNDTLTRKTRCLRLYAHTMCPALVVKSGRYGWQDQTP